MKLFNFLMMFLFLISNQTLAFDHILKLNHEINFVPPSTDWATFIVSTEMSLKAAEPILQKAPPGLFIGVGSERAFQGASLTKNAIHVLLIDFDTKIIRFNRINIELLKADSLAQYRKLRWDADFVEWQVFIAKNKRRKISLTQDDYSWWVANARDIMAVGNVRMEYINRYSQDVYYDNFIRIYTILSAHKLYSPSSFSDWQKAGLELSEKDWQWWDKFIVNPQFFTATFGKNWLETPSVAIDILSFRDLKSHNYLFSDNLYSKLHKLALANRITVCQIDIRNKKHINNLNKAIAQSKINLSVLDLDNIYMSGYVGKTNIYEETVNGLLSLGKNQSILLAMAPVQLNLVGYEAYFGFSFENVRQWPRSFSIARLVEENANALALINGRLYEGSELPKWTKVETK